MIAAATFDASLIDDRRAEVVPLSRGRLPFHWREAGPGQRRRAVELLSGLDTVHCVVVGTGLDNARQERHRRKCLQRLLWELEGFGVGHVVLDARRPQQDAGDQAAVAAWRAQRTLSARLRVDHARAVAEPLVWLADIVAGAVTAARGDGDDRYLKPLDAMLYEVRITLG